MSNDNVFPFPTTANQGPPMPDNALPQQRQPTPEELQKMEQQGGPEVLKLIQKNRQVAHQHLQSASEGLSDLIQKVRDNLPGDALWVEKNEKGDMYFSMEDALRNISRALGACLTGMEANNSLLDMLIHDLGGIVHNMNQTQRAMLIANSHTQTLLELLKEKGVVEESELKATWEKLVAEKQQEARENGMVPTNPGQQ